MSQNVVFVLDEKEEFMVLVNWQKTGYYNLDEANSIRITFNPCIRNAFFVELNEPLMINAPISVDDMLMTTLSKLIKARVISFASNMD